MAKAIKVVIALLGLVVIAIAAVFWMTSGMTETADAFFADIQSEDYASAYDYLSEAFTASTSKEDLIEFLEAHALVQVAQTSWSSRSISGSQGKLEGSVTTGSGGVIPITMKLVKENAAWKILSIHKPRVGISDSSEPTIVPDENERAALVHESLLQFARAVNARDFTVFYDHVAQFWQKDTSAAKFEEVFKPFMDADIDLLPALNVHRPRFDEDPSIGDDGFMTLKGHYPTKPSQLTFELSYMQEGFTWKLVGTNVNVEPVE